MLKRLWKIGTILVCLIMILSATGPVVTLSAQGIVQDNTPEIFIYLPNKQSKSILDQLEIVIEEDYGNIFLVAVNPSQQAHLEQLNLRMEPFENKNVLSFDWGEVITNEISEGKNAGPNDNQEGYYIVQFKGPVKSEWIQEISNIGVEIYGYQPYYAYRIKTDENTKERIQKLDFIRWVGSYLPEYKISKSLRECEGTLKVSVLLFQGEDPLAILQEVEAMGVLIIEFITRSKESKIIIQTDASNLLKIAGIEGVERLEPEIVNYAFNDDVTWITQSNVVGLRSIHERGIHGEENRILGENQIITMADTGLTKYHEMFSDPNHPIPGPDHRKIEDYYIPIGAVGDFEDGFFQPHGTHVAGTVLGDAPQTLGGTDWFTYNKYDGMAFKSRIIVQDIHPHGGGPLVFPPSDYDNMFQPALDADSYIHTNSWGGGSGYNGDSVQVDDFMWRNKDFTILFAMGNEGPGPTSLSAQAEAKNAISVGACQNTKAGGINPQNNMADFSSRGPATDGRIKPTIITPGDQVMSARKGTTDQYEQWSGTSMATPSAAGTAALVRQYYMEGYYPYGEYSPINGFTPSSALIKATLVNCGQEISGTGAYYNGLGFPNNDQGWGRILLDETLYFWGDQRKLKVFDSYSDLLIPNLNQGGKWTTFIDVFGGLKGVKDIKFTLVWTDPAAAAGTSPTLINDLDLTVTDPNGVIFKGNNFAGSNPGYSATGGTADRLNVVEGVHILPGHSFPTTIPNGPYKVDIDAFTVNPITGPQDFALVVTIGEQDEWPMFQHDERNTGFSTSYSPDIPPKELWGYTTGDRIYAGPVHYNNKVYVPCRGNLYCFDSDPTDDGIDEGYPDPPSVDYDLIWKFELTHWWFMSSPAVSNGRVFVPCFHMGVGKVYCLPEDDPSSDGIIELNEIIWEYSATVEGASPTVVNNKIFLNTVDDLLCLDINGNKLWSYLTGGGSWSSPAVAYGKVFVGCTNHKLYAIDENSGAWIWDFPIPGSGSVWSSPAVANHKVFVGSGFSFNYKVYALDEATGTPVWYYDTGGEVVSSPAVAYNRVYVGSFDGNTYCLPQDDSNGNGVIDPGEVNWIYPTGDVFSSPAVSGDGKVFIASQDSNLYALDALSGQYIWSWNIGVGDDVYSSPAIAEKNIYVGGAGDQTQCPFFAITQG